MSNPRKIILQKKKNIEKALPDYLKSRAFDAVVKKAAEDFVKRVKRGFLPDLSQIDALSDKYKELRKTYKNNLGKLGKPNKSNATATGQMLDAIIYEITMTGFIISVANSSRTKELNGGDSNKTNSEVAKYYSDKRKIFDLSDPEMKRITRNIKRDPIALIKNA